MISPLVISLAFIKTNHDSKKNDYLSMFLPLIEECIRADDNEIISRERIQGLMRDNFGLTIPLHVIKALISKLKHKGILIQKDLILYKNPNTEFDSDFKNKQQKIQRTYQSLNLELCKFAKEIKDKTYSEEEAEQLLLSFISYNQVKILRSEVNEPIFPELPELSTEEKIIVSEFINYANKCDQLLFEKIETIVIGFMLVNALYLPNLENTNKKFCRTQVFFDTSFIIYSLGYSGEEYRQPCIELLDLLYANGAQLRCFAHTEEEIKGILIACSKRLNQNNDTSFGRSIRFFVSQGFTSSDVLLMVSELRSNIEQLRIKVIDKPKYEDHEYVIAEEELEKTLVSRIPNYKNKLEALEKDIESIASIYRLRKGKNSLFIEDCQAIFITTNYSLIQGVEEFHRIENNDSIPPIISDFMMTNIVWLKTPTKAPTLPMKRIIADCYAAVQPSEALISKWLIEVEKLHKVSRITEDDYYFLRCSDEAISSLVNYTMGDSNEITEGSIFTILENARKKIQEPIMVELNTEREKNQKLEVNFNEEIGRNRKQNFDRLTNRKRVSQKIAHMFAEFCKGLVIFGFLLGSLLAFPYQLVSNKNFDFGKFLPSGLLFSVSILCLLLGILNMIYGTSINNMAREFEVTLGKWIFEKLSSVMGITDNL